MVDNQLLNVFTLDTRENSFLCQQQVSINKASVCKAAVKYEPRCSTESSSVVQVLTDEAETLARETLHTLSCLTTDPQRPGPP